jgi:4-hydroxy-4-methyl-2-oxoglutarate aldolase
VNDDSEFASAVGALESYGVATVYEASGRHGVIDADLIRVVPGRRVAGPARTVLCGQGDNRAVHEVMSVVQPGEILVLTMPVPQPVALVGELLLTQAKARGAAGVLVDASIRDVDEVRELGLPVWTRWIRVTGATKDLRGRLDVPVQVGGARINPGDVVVLDADGGVVVARDRVHEVAEASRQRTEKETLMRARLEAGELSYDIHGLRARDMEAVG